MPEYVLNRDYNLASVCGRVINFKKGVPTYVVPEAEKEALQIGATPLDGPKDILDPEAEPEVELSAEERKAKLFEAYAVLEQRQARGDFTAQGVPNLKALEKLTGFEVLNKERDATWREYKTGETE